MAMVGAAEFARWTGDEVSCTVAKFPDQELKGC